MLEKVKDEDTSYISDDVKIAEYKTKSTTKNKNFDKFWWCSDMNKKEIK